MKFFLEGSTYKSTVLKDILGDDVFGAVIKGNPVNTEQTVDCVGYCLSRDKTEHIFLLPKVFLKDGKAFGVEPIDPNCPITYSETLRKRLKNDGWNEDVVDELPLYLYLAIEKYRKSIEDSDIAESVEKLDVLTSKRDFNDRTLLDVILTLRDFYKENSNLFVLIYKQKHSGFNKVNWTKTVRTKMPAITEEEVIYPLVINRRKEINYDEELLVIFFNTLRYINQKYNFRFTVDQPYNLMPDSEFRRKFESGVVKKRLEAIRNRYFNEKLVELWQLLHIFADKADKIKSAKASSEYLLVRKFNIVFEAMIDCILGDANLPTKLWKQSDGKIVDHLFRGDSILGNGRQIYYIGDSKYYKDDRHPENESLFKQYTYAKNIIQQEINWYHKQESTVIYRDELTEGYNITPNFFICGFIDKEQGFTTDTLEAEGFNFKINYQFRNRIFDRDTLFLRQYNINFLFVLYAYVTHSQSVRAGFKKKAKNIFKEQFISYINSRYDFYILKPRFDDMDSLRNLIRGELFWRLNGKIISPYLEDDPNHGLLILGLESPAGRKETLIDVSEEGWKKHNHELAEENTKLLLSLEEHFIIKEYHLGTDPCVYYGGTINGSETPHSFSLMADIEENLSKFKTENVLFGCYRSEEHLQWILRTNLYNIRYTENRAGTVFGHNQKMFTASYLFLYNYSRPQDPARCFVLGTKHLLLDHYEMAKRDYPFGPDSREDDWYFIYHLFMQTESTITVDDVLACHPEATDGSPLYLHFAEVDSVIHTGISGDTEGSFFPSGFDQQD